MIRSSKYRKRGTSSLLTVVLIAGFLWTEGWAQMTEVNMGVAFVNARVAPLWVAEREGFFRKNGLDVKLTNIPGGTQGAQALLSGGIDVSYADPASTISAIAAGAQLVEVMAITTIMPYYLVGAPAVKTIADLRTINVPWEQDALETSRKSLQTKRDVIERVMKALLEGNAYVLNPANRSSLLELLRSRLGLKTTEEANAAYEDLIKYYVLKKPYPYREGLLSITAEIAKIVPKAASLRFEDIADSSIIEKLDKSGFIDSLYK